MATPKKLPSGSYQARWIVNGKRLSRTFATKKDANAFLLTIKADRLRGPLAPPVARKPLASWCRGWLETVKPFVSDQTYRTYGTTVRAIEAHAIGSIPLDVLGPSDVQHWVNEYSKTHSTNTTANALGVLKTALLAAKAQRVIRDLPTDGVRAPKRKTTLPDSVPTAEEIRKLVDAFGKGLTHGTATLVMTLTGCRWSEAYGLKPADIGDETITFRRTMGPYGKAHDGLKAGDERTVPVPVTLIRLLQGVSAITVSQKRSEFLFPVTSYRHWLRSVWNVACKEAGVEIRPHDLRRFAATQLDLAGVSQRGRMDLLGHSSAQVSAKYLKRTSEGALQAREALEAALLRDM